MLSSTQAYKPVSNPKVSYQFYPFQLENLEKNRKEREKIWNHFVDDMEHKKSRVDSTFEEKEEELREFYSDLERKLHIHK